VLKLRRADEVSAAGETGEVAAELHVSAATLYHSRAPMAGWSPTHLS
jgi:hypothetical protein